MRYVALKRLKNNIKEALKMRVASTTARPAAGLRPADARWGVGILARSTQNEPETGQDSTIGF